MIALFISRAFAYDISPNDLAESGPGDHGFVCLAALVIGVIFLIISLVIMKIAERSTSK